MIRRNVAYVAGVVVPSKQSRVENAMDNQTATASATDSEGGRTVTDGRTATDSEDGSTSSDSSSSSTLSSDSYRTTNSQDLGKFIMFLPGLVATHGRASGPTTAACG